MSAPVPTPPATGHRPPATESLARVCSYCRAAIAPDGDRLPTTHGVCNACAATLRQAIDDDEPLGAAALERALDDARAQANRWHSEYVALRQRHDHATHLLAGAAVDLQEAFDLLVARDWPALRATIRRAQEALASRPVHGA